MPTDCTLFSSSSLLFLRMEKSDREKEPRLRTASHKKQKGKIEELFVPPFLFPPFFPYRTNHDVGPFLLRHLLLIGFLPPSSGGHAPHSVLIVTGDGERKPL